MSTKLHKILTWFTRIIALFILIFALPFYFGYGNPLPFTNSDYTLWDNTWLSIFPFVFIGLALGWIFSRVGGFLVVIPIVIGFTLGLATLIGFLSVMLVPLVPGIAYIILGSLNPKSDPINKEP